MPLSLGYPATTGFRRVAWSFDGDPSKAPLLHVEYDGPSTPKVYYGHLHNHTSYSGDDGAKGTPAEAYDYARYKAGLNFFGIADHAEQLTPEEWNGLKSTAASKNADNAFVAFHGFEWTSAQYGHVAVMNTTDFTRSDSATTDTFSELVTWLSGKSGVAFFNHPINTYRVSVSADDAEENTTTKSVSLSSSDLEIVYDPDINANQLVGIRFIIPYLQRGAIITNAYIQFTAKGTSTGPGKVSIRCQDIANDPVFTTNPGNISSRTYTPNNVLWSPADWSIDGEADIKQQTPDLKAILQPILNKEGWNPGNAIVFRISGANRL